jgi:hypothetical protein
MKHWLLGMSIGLVLGAMVAYEYGYNTGKAERPLTDASQALYAMLEKCEDNNQKLLKASYQQLANILKGGK